MRHKHFVSVCLLAGFLITPATGLADEIEAKTLPPIYDTKADASADTTAALARAGRHGTRVLLQFGANWCPWCHKLHALFQQDADIKRLLRDEYEIVLVDVDQGRNAKFAEKYGDPGKLGLPALIVLDADGKTLIAQETGSLEAGDHHDPVKVLAFLKKFQAPQRDSQAILNAAMKKAGLEKKNAFVYFTAPWCLWCHRLDAYLADPTVAATLEKSFVPVMIDVERFRNGQELLTRYHNGDPGFPFFAIINPTGKKLADAISPQGNIGFPTAPQEIAHFMALLKKWGRNLTEKDLALLETKLKAARPESAATPPSP